MEAVYEKALYRSMVKIGVSHNTILDFILKPGHCLKFPLKKGYRTKEIIPSMVSVGETDCIFFFFYLNMKF